MRFLRITLEEHKHGTVFRAERVITPLELSRYRFKGQMLEVIVEDLEKELDREITNHER